MPRTYVSAPANVLARLDSVCNRFHPALVQAEVRWTVLMVHAPRDAKTGDPKPPALKLHGYPARAIIKINPLEKRVSGLGDVTLLLDGDDWPFFSDAEQDAILDHEAQHLEIVVDEETGAPLTDDACRPKLKMRPHDWHLGGFAAVVERHGDAATEKQAFKLTADTYGQMLMPWG